jgi:hypothetical protein
MRGCMVAHVAGDMSKNALVGWVQHSEHVPERVAHFSSSRQVACTLTARRWSGRAHAWVRARYRSNGGCEPHAGHKDAARAGAGIRLRANNKQTQSPNLAEHLCTSHLMRRPGTSRQSRAVALLDVVAPAREQNQVCMHALLKLQSCVIHWPKVVSLSTTSVHLDLSVVA